MFNKIRMLNVEKINKISTEIQKHDRKSKKEGFISQKQSKAGNRDLWNSCETETFYALV